jgi:hypothetical protein
VAAYYWTIPVREDRRFEPQDFMKIGRTRSLRTASVKLFDLDG